MSPVHTRGPVVCAIAAAAALSGAAIAQDDPIAAGAEIYTTQCALCHGGGDETAPPLDTLHSLDPDRIATALTPDGLMSLQAGLLSADERDHVIAFLTASSEDRAGLDVGAGALAENLPDFPYPVRRIREEPGPAPFARPPAWPRMELGEGPFEFQSWEQRNYRVVVAARGLTRARSLDFLPNGDALITEVGGTLRRFSDGELLPDPVPGVPESVFFSTATGLMDVALHPDFENNQLIYIAYHKPVYGSLGSNAIFRGRWTGDEIVDGEDIFLSDDVDALYTRLAFGPDGKLYATIGAPGVGTMESRIRSQHPDDYAGKVLRLNDDGSVPEDNPFVGVEGYNPEIFSLGHRVQLGTAFNPWTGEMWASENGPQGGDEVNIVRATQNYGWPLVSDGRQYSGERVSEEDNLEGMVRPHISFVPSIAASGIMFYTGDKFPGWERNLFVGGMRMGRTPNTGHLVRFAFNENWEEIRREMLLVELHQRIRDVAQDPEGYIWVITDEGDDSALMRLEPMEEPEGESDGPAGD
ncbi:MAG: PQQ-dependent sugar dehydrogenase [Maricaulaceae bacterium]|jgi:glucose/arabinose dehydrogenase